MVIQPCDWLEVQVSLSHGDVQKPAPSLVPPSVLSGRLTGGTDTTGTAGLSPPRHRAEPSLKTAPTSRSPGPLHRDKPAQTCCGSDRGPVPRTPSCTQTVTHRIKRHFFAAHLHTRLQNYGEPGQRLPARPGSAARARVYLRKQIPDSGEERKL